MASFIFFGVYEKSDWIIIETFQRCETFNNVLDFKNELIRTVNLSSQNAKLELLKSHPELTGKIGIKKFKDHYSYNKKRLLKIIEFAKNQKADYILTTETIFIIIYICVCASQ